MSGPVGAVVVGAGLMGRWHAHDLRRAGGRVAAVVDPDQGRADALARAHGARAAVSLGEALADASVRVVHVCTPTDSHRPLVREALDAGRHVVCEKPLTETPEETDALLGLADAGGLQLTPVHQFPFQRGVRALRRARLGPLRHLSGVACSAGADGGDAASRDVVAGEILPHFLALTAAFVEAPLAGLEWRGFRPDAGELEVATVAAGVVVAIRISMRGRPPRTTWEVTGEAGSGHADLFHGFSVVETGGVGRAHKALRPLAVSSRTLVGAAANLAGRAARRQPAYPGLRELLGEVYRAVRTGAPGPIPPDEVRGIAVARRRILEAIAV